MFRRRTKVRAGVMLVALVGAVLAVGAVPAQAGGGVAIPERAAEAFGRRLALEVKPSAVDRHLRAFQRIADANGGNRASGEAGSSHPR